jgi:hypothetical protein
MSELFPSLELHQLVLASKGRRCSCLVGLLVVEFRDNKPANLHLLTSIKWFVRTIKLFGLKWKSLEKNLERGMVILSPTHIQT